ncbi:sensor histidine kinase [Streptomyces sp. NPDC003333]
MRSATAEEEARGTGGGASVRVGHERPGAAGSAVRWLAGQRGSLRLRLTVVFGLLFFFAAAAVLAATVLLVHRYRQYHPPTQPYLKFDPPLTTQQRAQAWRNWSQLSADARQDAQGDVEWMLKWGALIVTGVGVTATAVGWLVAGRLLRPLSRISRIAERVAGHTLHQRIALHAPPGEVKTLADSFDRMLERLDESFAGQGRFIGNAAHELKTPLVLNRTLVEVAMNRPDAPPQLRRLGESLLTVNTRHERLIDGLLVLARSENDLAERLPADLRPAVEAVLEHAAPDAERGGISLRTDLGPAPLRGDPVLLEHLARNLVDNALRYNRPGGTVHVTTRTVPEGARLTVSNTGPAIDPAEVPTLFQPFRRLTDRIGSAEGSGLGLSIVRAVARVHGGDVHATALSEGGLTVTVTLPGGPHVPSPRRSAPADLHG